MAKKGLSTILRLLADKLDNNECSSNDIEQLEKVVCEVVNPFVTRKFAVKYYEVKETTFDNQVSRKLPERDKMRNVVMYPFKKLCDIFCK